jgi:hypothetical protein
MSNTVTYSLLATLETTFGRHIYATGPRKVWPGPTTVVSSALSPFRVLQLQLVAQVNLARRLTGLCVATGVSSRVQGDVTARGEKFLPCYDENRHARIVFCFRVEFMSFPHTDNELKLS